MALVVIAIPVLALVMAIYWLRQPLIYDVLFLVTRRCAIRRVIQTMKLNDIDDLIGRRIGYSHYSVTWSDLQHTPDASVRVTMPAMSDCQAHTPGVWPEILYRIDRLVFFRNRTGPAEDRTSGRELDLSRTVKLLLKYYTPPSL